LAARSNLTPGIGKTVGDALIATQAAQPLQLRTAALFAPDASARHDQHQAMLKTAAEPEVAAGRFMNLTAAAATTLTVHDLDSRLQMQFQRPSVVMQPHRALKPIARAPKMLQRLAIHLPALKSSPD
jgi:hypothetical protein